jgi:cytochrome P450
MLGTGWDNAIADHKTYGSVDAQHRLFAELRRDDPVHWTQPDGYRPFWTLSKYADIIEIERQADRFKSTADEAAQHRFREQGQGSHEWQAHACPRFATDG